MAREKSNATKYGPNQKGHALIVQRLMSIHAAMHGTTLTSRGKRTQTLRNAAGAHHTPEHTGSTCDDNTTAWYGFGFFLMAFGTAMARPVSNTCMPCMFTEHHT